MFVLIKLPFSRLYLILKGVYPILKALLKFCTNKNLFKLFRFYQASSPV